MAKNSLTKAYDALPHLAKIILQIVFGWIVGGIYRVVRYTEKKNTKTLVVGILGLIPPVDLVLWVVDLYTQITEEKITFCAD